ncbi:MAG: GNAT family N-acetyltransferase [Candidatus Nanopelagicaceae bacterium]|nr:GNAT family N-acetyltransferase [Candidatus Nanopelagicaceae bacterium]
MELSEKALNPDASPVALTEAEEILSGYIDGVEARKLVNKSNGRIESIITVHPDKSRGRIYADSWQLPGSNLETLALKITLELAKSLSEDDALWIGANALDQSYISILKTYDFELLRTYRGLRAPVKNIRFPDLPVDFQIRKVNSEADLNSWWKVHQDSFQFHFGFKPRTFEDWKAIVAKAVGVDPEARWLLLYQNKAVGFIECSDLKIDQNTGYVDGLGVIQEFQGRGLGELLLKWAFAYYSAKGITHLELNVDTGNESGALKLYEKLGMKPKHSWQQYQNLDWETLNIK